MKEITFNVEPCNQTGGFVARWDEAPDRGGITTQGDTLSELHAMVTDAVSAYFDSKERPNVKRVFKSEEAL